MVEVKHPKPAWQANRHADMLRKLINIKLGASSSQLWAWWVPNGQGSHEASNVTCYGHHAVLHTCIDVTVINSAA